MLYTTHWCGHLSTYDGEPVSLNVETIGGALMVQHYIAVEHLKTGEQKFRFYGNWKPQKLITTTLCTPTKSTQPQHLKCSNIWKNTMWILRMPPLPEKPLPTLTTAKKRPTLQKVSKTKRWPENTINLFNFTVHHFRIIRTISMIFLF